MIAIVERIRGSAMSGELETRQGHCSETNLPMLRNVQGYLQSLLDHKVPDSMLAAAWDEFFHLYDDLIRRFAVARGVSWCDIDDCVQEVWREVAVRLIKFDRPADRPGLRAWIYTLVRSKATNLFRKNARHRSARLEVAAKDVNAPAPDAADRYEREWERALADSAIAQLRQDLSPTNDRLLTMRLLECRSVQETALELNLSPAQVHARQHRILKKLRARVAVYSGDC